MKTRRVFIGVLGAAAIAASVLVGGVSGASTVATQSPLVQNPYPFSKGDQFVYSYSDASEALKAAPMATPARTLVVGTLTRTIGDQVMFNGKPATQVNDVRKTSETVNGKLVSTGSLTTQRFQAFVRTGGNSENYVEYGQDQSGTQTTTGGTKNTSMVNETDTFPLILDKLPETPSEFWRAAFGFSNSFLGQTQTAGRLVSASSGSSTRKGDGAYSSMTTTSSRTSTVTDMRTQNANGTGSENNNGMGPKAGTTTFGLPHLIQDLYYIPVTRRPPGDPTTTTEVPDWFPGNGRAPTLFTDIVKDVGLASAPPTCGKYGAYVSVKLTEAKTFLDVIEGTYSQDTVYTYVVDGLGIICTVETQTIHSYNNLSSGNLMATQRRTVVTILTRETLPGSRRR